MQVNILKHHSYFFIGIAGTGMSAIAQYLAAMGKRVAGSDRQFNGTDKTLIEEQFGRLGIQCFPQDGKGITPDTGAVIISAAIEQSNIEYCKALALNIPVFKRSEILAALSETKKTIAVGGTSGKSTTTAMIYHILDSCKTHPSLMSGAGLVSLQEKGLPGNAFAGDGDWLVIEADESDGSIVNYKPEISVLLNIDRDHKEMNELLDLFNRFKKNTRTRFIVNASHPLTCSLSADHSFDFGLAAPAGFIGANFSQKEFIISFTVNGIDFTIPVPGRHNMENALAAVACCSAAGIGLEPCAHTLRSFPGIYRRMQRIGVKRGITVIDDFAHNPAEIEAAIKACQSAANRVICWFQPHGYGPLKFMKDELSERIAATMNSRDKFYISNVYYAGGTVSKDVSPQEVTDRICHFGRIAYCIPDRNKMFEEFHHIAYPGDVILLMGARDPSLNDFAKAVLQHL